MHIDHRKVAPAAMEAMLALQWAADAGGLGPRLVNLAETCESTATADGDHCFIGRHLAPSVAYQGRRGRLRLGQEVSELGMRPRQTPACAVTRREGENHEAHSHR